MGDARNRFSSGFYSRSYSIDRLVGAANMFDLIPASKMPTVVPLDEETKKSIDCSKGLFRTAPDSTVRQSILSVLDRAGRPSLRDKVYHRAKLITEASPDSFTDLKIPCGQAVLCRSHYVHGSAAPINYNEDAITFAFLTDTLEFVFAISDLLELGWDLNSWSEKGSSYSHSFGSYRINYQANLARLKALL